MQPQPPRWWNEKSEIAAICSTQNLHFLKGEWDPGLGATDAHNTFLVNLSFKIITTNHTSYMVDTWID
jgi:hypothetical protein